MKKRIWIPLVILLAVVLAALAVGFATGFFTRGAYQQVGGFSNGLAWVCKADRYGYINPQGELVIDCFWANAKDFTEGYAAVSTGDKWGYINTDGHLVVPCVWDAVYPFQEGLAMVCAGVPWQDDASFGFVDGTGELVLPCIYSDATNFHNGMAYVEQRSGVKRAFINQAGEVLFKPDESLLRNFSEGFAAFNYWENGNWYSFVDETGRRAFADGWKDVSDFSEGLATVYRAGDVVGYQEAGFINTSGQLVIPYAWDWASSFHEGLCAVKRDGKFGFIDTKGFEVIPLQWEWATDFEDGVALVAKNGGKWGVIAPDGQLLLPCECDSISYGEGLFCLLKNGHLRIAGKDAL